MYPVIPIRTGSKSGNRPQLLSDIGPSYISGELSAYLEDKGMSHTRGRPYHPQTQGKIECLHRTMKNQILLNNLTPTDVFYGRGQKILDERQAIKLNTLVIRRKMHYDHRNNLNLMS